MSSVRHQSTSSNTVFDPILKVFHVGGRGPGMGPVERLLPLGENLSFSIFEANIEEAGQGIGVSSQDDYDRLTVDYANRYGVKVSVIQQCLSDCVGRKTFHINVIPDCSSLLNMSPNAKNYTRMAGEGMSTNIMPSFSALLKGGTGQKLYTRMPGNEYRMIWGQVCQPTRNVEIEVTTLDELYDKHVVQLPHFLSLDIQGAEYDVLRGASKALQGDLLGVLTEVEFRELYQDQKLFVDQHKLLKNHQFSLFELYNTEYWYSGQILGKGALTVAEALFLRDFKYFVEKYKEPALLLSNLAKLAIVAYSFERISYAFEIMEYVTNYWQNEWDVLTKQSGNGYLQSLLDFYQHVINNKPQLEKVPTYLKYLANNVNPPHKSKLFEGLKYILYLAYNVNLKGIVEKFRSPR